MVANGEFNELKDKVHELTPHERDMEKCFEFKKSSPTVNKSGQN